VRDRRLAVMQYRKGTSRKRTIPIAVAAIAGSTDEAGDLLESRPGLVFEAASILRRVRRPSISDRFTKEGAGK